MDIVDRDMHIEHLKDKMSQNIGMSNIQRAYSNNNTDSMSERDRNMYEEKIAK